MSRSTSVFISVVIVVLAVLLFTVWRNVMDEYGAYIAIGFALAAVFLATAPSRSTPEKGKVPD